MTTITDATMLPPPYVEKDPTQLLNSSAGDSEPNTPLPSYSSSPLLSPILAIAVPKLDLSPSSPCTSSNSSRSTRSTVPQSLLEIVIAFFSPTFVDAAYWAMLNVLGCLFILVQVPLAIVLAKEFDLPPTGQKVMEGGKDRKGWIRTITQLMWDIHDHLEEAELCPPSSWQR